MKKKAALLMCLTSLSIGLSACSDPESDSKGGLNAACTTNADCASNLCIANKCSVNPCQGKPAGTVCGENMVCDANGKCIAGTPDVTDPCSGKPAGTVCGENKVCDADGKCIDKTPDAANPCDGKPAGTTCGENKVCDANGKCIDAAPDASSPCDGKNAGAACGKNKVCDENGKCIDKTPDAGSPCSGKPAGTACGENKVCDKDGKCVDKKNDGTCPYITPECSADGSTLYYCDETGRTAEKDCECYKGECVYSDCSYSGTRCSNDAKEVRECNKKTKAEFTVEHCTGLCKNGACAPVPCPSPDAKTCVTGKISAACENNQMVQKKCTDDQICAKGECVAASADTKCDFETTCTPEKDGLLECVEGKVKYTKCHNGESCLNNACVKTETCENFRNYCTKGDGGEDLAVYCKPNAAKPTTQKCNGVCRDGMCVSNITLGAECNVNGQWPGDTCIGNVIATCINGKVREDKNCEDQGMICGMVRDGEINIPGCYNACETRGKKIKECVEVNPKDIISQEYECTQLDASIGDGRLGLVPAANGYNPCDIDCIAGECVDYTEGLDDIGTDCEEDKFTSRCDNGRAIICDVNSNKVEAYKCDYNEVCSVPKGLNAACRLICKKGDPDIHQCAAFISSPASFKYTCQTDGTNYFYAESPDDYIPTICEHGCNPVTGLCNEK